jgi:hypothetical protein
MTGCEVSWNHGPACGKSGRMYRTGCVHEHVADGEMCGEHAAQLNGSWMCSYCEAIDGHRCPLTTIELHEERRP